MILVTSPPACGKSFVTDKLARALKNCVYLDKDSLLVLSAQIFKVAGEPNNRSSQFFEDNVRNYEYDAILEVAFEALKYNDYVLITLYVDNKTPLTSPVKVTENGRERTLRTVGDKWSYLQRVKFGANAQPFYVLIDNEGRPLNKSYSYDEDIPKYIEFLQTGLENYKKGK